jgi:hypothetical protein
MALEMHFDRDALRPLVAEVVEETLRRLDAAKADLPDKLAFTEAESARLLSLHPHQLRDERLRGRIQASVGPGRRILYCREDLLAYLRSRRWKSSDGRQ